MTIEPLLPDPKDPRLSRGVEGVDENGEHKSITVTDVESKLEKKTRTSGCAVGTVFGDMMAGHD
ncbi:hypothetical protein [Marinobacter sp. S0848L]|uniref:hypothetical protein n=1 Tax=Marinobacter sp. S0848L TaxID=2926423 RepID=UPI001FF29F8C|nr:hypothetical protein [Marinobacter sp. S0848L]MCK0106632.1 hypothetical protein [Marinobacter sp. S0848L]